MAQPLPHSSGHEGQELEDQVLPNGVSHPEQENNEEEQDPNLDRSDEESTPRAEPVQVGDEVSPGRSARHVD